MIAFRKSQAARKGIERCNPSELLPEFYRMTSKWSGLVEGRQVTVYAGSLLHNSAKGVLVLRTLPQDGRRIGGRHCTAPQNSGPLEIVESRGSRLRISRTEGGDFWFEIPHGLRQAA